MPAGVCRKCGCTEADCTDCVERTGRPCSWAEADLCTACLPRFEVLGLVVVRADGLFDPKQRDVCFGYTMPPGSIGEVHGHALAPDVAWPRDLVELWLPADTWEIARRLLPRLAEQGRIAL